MASPQVTKSARDLRSAQRSKGNVLPSMDLETLLTTRARLKPSRPGSQAALLTTKEGLNEYLIGMMQDPEQTPQVHLSAAKQVSELNGLTTGADSDLRTKSDEELFELLEQFSPLMREFLRPPPNPMTDVRVARCIAYVRQKGVGHITYVTISRRCFRGNILQTERFVENMARAGIGRATLSRTGSRGRPSRVFEFDFEVIAKLEELRAKDQRPIHERLLGDPPPQSGSEEREEEEEEEEEECKET